MNHKKGFQPRRTLFVGGISASTTEKAILQYFKQFAKVSKVEIMKHKKNRAPKGFAYVTLADAVDIPKILQLSHEIAGRKIDCQIAASKKEKQKTKEEQKKKMVFVTNLPPDLRSEELQAHFSKYGSVRNTYVIFDTEKNESKQFGYVEFFNTESVLSIINTSVDILGTSVQCWPYLGRHEKRGHSTSDFEGSVHLAATHLEPEIGGKEESSSRENSMPDPAETRAIEAPAVSSDKLIQTQPHQKYEYLSFSAHLNQSTSNYRFNRETKQRLPKSGFRPLSRSYNVCFMNERCTSGPHRRMLVNDPGHDHDFRDQLGPLAKQFYPHQELPMFLR